MEKIQIFAERVKQEHKAQMIKEGFTNQDVIDGACETKIIPGKKYTKVDIGQSGKFMIDGEDIYGIKAYGVIHRGHHYGTLDTINDWYWGTYYPQKKLTA